MIAFGILIVSFIAAVIVPTCYWAVCVLSGWVLPDKEHQVALGVLTMVAAVIIQGVIALAVMWSENRDT